MAKSIYKERILEELRKIHEIEKVLYDNLKSCETKKEEDK